MRPAGSRAATLVWTLALALVPAWAARAAEGDGVHLAPSVTWQHGDHRVDLGASLRVRNEGWDAFASDLRWYTALRTRLRAQYGWRQRLLLAAEFQDLRLYGMNDDGSGALALYRNANGGASSAIGDSLRGLWAEARPSQTSFLRVGRQDVKLGHEALYPEPGWRYLKTARLGERLVGTVGWSHAERAYDGGAAGWDLDGVQLFGFYARPTTGVFDVEDAYEPLRGITVGGATLTAKRGVLLESTEIGLFGLGYWDDRPTSRGGLPGDVRVGTLGAHWLGVYRLGPGNVDVLAWAAAQFGEYDGLDHGAGAGIVEVGYQLFAVFAAPWLRAGLNIASGDAEPTDGDHETFFNMLPTNHIYYGFADQLAFQNLVNWFVQLRAAPHPMAALNLFVHWFRLEDAHDARYSGSGAFSKSAFGFTAAPSRGLNHIGTEYDLVLTLTPHRTTTVELGYAFLDGGAMLQQAAGRNVHFLYASLEVKY